MINPLLDWFHKLCGMEYNSMHRFVRPDKPGSSTTEIYARQVLVSAYAWAIPNDVALRVIASHSPLVEIGAGTGYWAWLLSHQYNALVVAYDKTPPTDPPEMAAEMTRAITPIDWDSLDDRMRAFINAGEGRGRRRKTPRPRFFPVLKGGPEKVCEHPGHTLFLCWPSYNDPMAADCLKNYEGDVLLYVGEHDGCTGDEEFCTLLSRDWEEEKTVTIPQWFGTHDYLWVYRRKSL